MLPLYVIHAASRTAIVTQIIVLRENWIKQYMFFHLFFCVKTPKEAARSWRRRRIVQVHLNKLECHEKVISKSVTFIYFRFFACKVKHFKSFFGFNFDD